MCRARPTSRYTLGGDQRRALIDNVIDPSVAYDIVYTYSPSGRLHIERLLPVKPKQHEADDVDAQHKHCVA